MYPLLFKIGPLPVHTYGVLIAIGFMVAIQIIKNLATRSQLDAEKVLDFSFWVLLVGFLGARLLFIITRFSSFAADPIQAFKIWEGGLVFYGGPFLVVPFSIWYLRKHNLNWWKVADCMLPGLTAAHAFGRLGCLAAGCCYGRPTGSSWGVRLYSDLVDSHLHGVPLHPTQLYESGALFILVLGLHWVFKRKRFDGQVGLTYFMAYPIIRSIVEIFRGDAVRGFVIDDVLSTSQFLSIILFAAATALLVFRLKQLKTETPTPAAA